MTDSMFGYHVDLKRAMWRRDYLQAYMETLAAWGFNTIIFEIEDKFIFEKHPAISHPDALSHAVMAEVVASCRALGMEAVPLVQSLGHAEYVLGKPPYAPLREVPDQDSQYNTRSEAARSLIADLFDEAIDVMRPREFFHMGGDEARFLGASPAAAELAREKGIGYIYLQHMLPLFEHVRRRGLRPIVWADMVLRHPEILPDLPRYVVLMDWDYWTREERVDTIHLWGGGPKGGEIVRLKWDELQAPGYDGIRKLVEPFAVDERTRSDGTFRPFHNVGMLTAMGFDVITASANRFGGVKTGIPMHETHIPNSFLFTRKGMQAGRGAVVTFRAIRHCHPEVLHPATYAASLAAHDGMDYDFDAICRAFTTEYFGLPLPEFAEAVVKAGQPTRLTPAAAIAGAREVFRKGTDPLPGELDKLQHGTPAPRADLERLLADYSEARETFLRMQKRARRNAHNVDFWIEGIDLDIFYTRFLQAARDGTLRGNAARMLEQLEGLRSRSRPLLAESYTPRSVESELDQRYGFHEEYLQTMEAL